MCGSENLDLVLVDVCLPPVVMTMSGQEAAGRLSCLNSLKMDAEEEGQNKANNGSVL